MSRLVPKDMSTSQPATGHTAAKIRVAGVSCLLHRPGLFGYNRLTVGLAAAAAEKGLVEWTWVGPGIHSSFETVLPGTQYRMANRRYWFQTQAAFYRADCDLRPDVWHVL